LAAREDSDLEPVQREDTLQLKHEEALRAKKEGALNDPAFLVSMFGSLVGV